MRIYAPYMHIQARWSIYRGPSPSDVSFMCKTTCQQTKFLMAGKSDAMQRSHVWTQRQTFRLHVGTNTHNHLQCADRRRASSVQRSLTMEHPHSCLRSSLKGCEDVIYG